MYSIKKIPKSLLIVLLIIPTVSYAEANWSLKASLNKEKWNCGDAFKLQYEITSEKDQDRDTFLAFSPYLFINISIYDSEQKLVPKSTIMLKANYSAMPLIRATKGTKIKIPVHFQLNKNRILKNTYYEQSFNLEGIKKGIIRTNYLMTYENIFENETLEANPLVFTNNCF